MTDPELQALVRGLVPAVRELVTAALQPVVARVAALEAQPPARDGRDGQNGPPGPPGAPGRDGADGVNGADGKDGLGFDAFEARYDGERTVTHRYACGDRVKEYSFVLPIPVYRGVWQRTAHYTRGDCVTFGGSLWHANETPSPAVKPGDGSTTWTLSVKRGQDGKDGG